jgi:hypothetical protein
VANIECMYIYYYYYKFLQGTEEYFLSWELL